MTLPAYGIQRQTTIYTNIHISGMTGSWTVQGTHADVGKEQANLTQHTTIWSQNLLATKVSDIQFIPGNWQWHIWMRIWFCVVFRLMHCILGWLLKLSLQHNSSTMKGKCLGFLYSQRWYFSRQNTETCEYGLPTGISPSIATRINRPAF